MTLSAIKRRFFLWLHDECAEAAWERAEERIQRGAMLRPRVQPWISMKASDIAWIDPAHDEKAGPA